MGEVLSFSWSLVFRARGTVVERAACHHDGFGIPLLEKLGPVQRRPQRAILGSGHLPLGWDTGGLKSILPMEAKLRQQLDHRWSVPDAGEPELMPQGKGRSSFQARQFQSGNSGAEFAQREG